MEKKIPVIVCILLIAAPVCHGGETLKILNLNQRFFIFKMAKKIPMCVCILLLTTPVCHALTFGEFLAGAAGVVAAPFVIPAALGAAGFTATGIAAGSLGAAAMSASAPVATGSFVAIAQSIGATGAIGLAGKAIGGGVGYAAYRATEDRD